MDFSEGRAKSNEQSRARCGAKFETCDKSDSFSGVKKSGSIKKEGEEMFSFPITISMGRRREGGGEKKIRE